MDVSWHLLISQPPNRELITRDTLGLVHKLIPTILFNFNTYYICTSVLTECVREVSLTLVSYTHIGMNVCVDAYENGCVVDDMCAMAAD